MKRRGEMKVGLNGIYGGFFFGLSGFGFWGFWGVLGGLVVDGIGCEKMEGEELEEVVAGSTEWRILELDKRVTFEFLAGIRMKI